MDIDVRSVGSAEAHPASDGGAFGTMRGIQASGPTGTDYWVEIPAKPEGKGWDSYRRTLFKRLLQAETNGSSAARRLLHLFEGQPAAPGIANLPSPALESVLLAQDILRSFDDATSAPRPVKAFATEEGGIRLQRTANDVSRAVEINPGEPMVGRTAYLRPPHVDEVILDSPEAVIAYLA